MKTAKNFMRISKKIIAKCASALTSNKSYTSNMGYGADMSKVVREAEKIVGYPTSFLNLRWLLNNEMTNVTTHLNKIHKTKHPILKIFRDLFISRKKFSYGLVVLLISKAGGITKQMSEIERDSFAGILHHQRILAEITEMIFTSNVFHRSIFNVSSHVDKSLEDLRFGNKLSILIGDYLISNAFRELAEIKCYEVNELIATAARDLAESSFIEPRDRQNNPLPARPVLHSIKEISVPYYFEKNLVNISELLGNAKSEWILRHLLQSASLLGRCCQATLVLSNHSKTLQKSGYIVGANMALALQLQRDLEQIDAKKTGPFSLINAPLMFHFEDNPKDYNILMVDVEMNNIDYNKIRNFVIKGNGIIKSLKLQQEFIYNGMAALNIFPENGARNVLFNIFKNIFIK